MSHHEHTLDVAGETAAAETSLGRALAAIHRALARLDEPSLAADVRAHLRKAVSLLDSARHSHALANGGDGSSHGAVAPEIVAAIAAAISTVLTGPYRLVSVQQVVVPVAHQTAWAVEGRAQIFRSHRVR